MLILGIAAIPIVCIASDDAYAEWDSVDNSLLGFLQANPTFETNYTTYIVSLPSEGAAGQIGGRIWCFDDYEAVSNAHISGSYLIVTGSPAVFRCTVNGESFTVNATIEFGSKEHYDFSASTFSYYYASLYYKANGGSGASFMDSRSIYSTYADGSYAFTVSSEIPVRTGYDFLGWAESSTAITTIYQPGDKFVVAYGTSRTLYAVWSATASETKDYNVTYVCVGPATAQTVTVSEGSYTLIEPYAENTGHEFAGWLCSDGTLYQPGDKVDVSSDLTFSGQWTPVKYTVTFDPCNGGAVFTQQVAFGEAASRPDDPAKDGYIFTHWRIQDDGRIYAFSKVTADISLYADYDKISSGDVDVPVDPDEPDDSGSDGSGDGSMLSDRTGFIVVAAVLILIIFAFCGSSRRH